MRLSAACCMIIIAFAVALLCFQWVKIIKVVDYNPPIEHIVEPKLRAAMEYHGITFSTSNQDGAIWFERNGKICKLYTEAFKTYWAKR